VLERELAPAHLTDELFRLLPVDEGLGLLDEAEDVAHPENAPDHAGGIEGLEGVDLLAETRELDRPARDRGRGERGSAPRVAVELAQHDAGDPDPTVELLGALDRVL